MKAPIKENQTPLEQFLRENAAKGIIDYHVRASTEGDGVSIYLHAANADSETLDFDVMGDTIWSSRNYKNLLGMVMEKPAKAADKKRKGK